MERPPGTWQQRKANWTDRCNRYYFPGLNE